MELVHHPPSLGLGPTFSAPAIGDNFQVPANGEGGGGVEFGAPGVPPISSLAFQLVGSLLSDAASISSKLWPVPSVRSAYQK